MEALVFLFVASCVLAVITATRADHLSGAERVELDALRNENAILDRRLQRAAQLARRELLLPNAPEGLLRHILDILSPGGI